METLCAYVRKNAGVATFPTKEVMSLQRKRPNRLNPSEEDTLRKHWKSVILPSVDVQAAISVIGRRTQEQRSFESVQREAAAGQNSNAWRLDLTGCNILRANFGGLDFSEALFTGSNIEGGQFSNAALQGARFIGAHLPNTRFDNATLDRANCFGCHMPNASLWRANLNEATFEGAYLDNASFQKASLIGAFFYGTHLNGAGMQSVNAEGAMLDSANLECATLTAAHLEGASLFGASLEHANLEQSTLTGCDLGCADLRKVKGLKPEQLERTWGDASTGLPPNILAPIDERWTIEVIDIEADRTRDMAMQADRNDWIALAKMRIT
jgi:uncharacterized protein YjbI with pentapeptide repeats